MFVAERTGTTSCGISGGQVAGGCSLDLAWGVHPDLNKCDSEHPCDATSPFATCAASGLNTGHCVDSSGNQPTVTDGVLYAFTAATNAGANEIRVIQKELLQGNTVEDFVCACARTECTSAATGLVSSDHTCVARALLPAGTTPANCPAGGNVSNDPKSCSGCGDNPNTADVDETNKCLDLNLDGNPDAAVLKAGVVHFDCGAVQIDTGQFDGFYNPSGNQLIPAFGGLEGLGPAIDLRMLTALPANTDCTVTMGTAVTDKDGNKFGTPTSPMTFHTEPVNLLTNRVNPPPDQTGVSKGMADCNTVPADCTKLTIGFNTKLSPMSIAAGDEVTVAPMGGGAAIPGTLAFAATTGATAYTSIVWTAGAQLAASTTYVVTVKKTSGTAADVVQDGYGKGLTDDITYMFTTGT